MIHFIKDDKTLLCESNENFGCTWIGLVDCPKCLSLYKKCTFCTRQSINDANHFYPVCIEHLILGQIQTERFFNQNPDYTKWNKK